MKQNLTEKEQAVEVVHPDSGLTASQEKCAILLASGIRVTDAAQQVGASRASVYRWLDNDAFACYYNLMKKEVQGYVEGALLELHQKALAGITASLDSPREDLRLKASMWVVEKVSQMPIGETSVRKLLQNKVKMEVSDGYLTIGGTGLGIYKEQEYKKKLQEAGLEE
ncbi:MAG: hypothetical protein IJ151_00890 [Bacteroidales bacterium]|nr:hypothetical protein [Bacteroidales bacterium]